MVGKGGGRRDGARIALLLEKEKKGKGGKRGASSQHMT